MTKDRLELSDKLFFAWNRANLRPASHATLDDVVKALNDHPTIRVRIEGHTDTSGNAAHNQKLSQRRAESVRDYLIKNGIAADRLEAKGFGPSVALESNETAVGRETNRRVEFVIISTTNEGSSKSSSLRITLLIALCSCVAACGRQIVEFQLGDGSVDGRGDGSVDGPGDGPGDGSVDAPISVPPVITLRMPGPGATGIGLGTNVTATFSKPMELATINLATFTLTQGATPVDGMVTLNGAATTATFDPMLALTAGLDYTATVTTGAEDTDGLALAAAHSWTFTTGTSNACVVPPIGLGTAGAFAVLAGSAVTNTGPTSVTGDLGVYPGTSVTSFPPGILAGTQYAGIAPSDTAQGDLTIAYNDAASRTLCLVSVIGDLGGMTLPPGLYKSTSFLSLTTGDLVLDAQGDPNAVWIFSMASELTISNSRQVTIIGGGSAANVYWQVGSSATLGTAAMFKGTIMADQSISLATGAVLEGRALARIAAVTLDSSTVMRP